ncbi:hypothetical protein [Streptomyces sp. NPDC058486]|uniref:hypothetical protein n=1 Tax=unclassified Streptomyces TaxID=2593676 RepID=UPI00364E84A2
MSILSVHTDSLRSSDRERALRALSALADPIAPQGVAFESDAVTYVPHLLGLALTEKIIVQAEVLNYLANVYGSALWSWRRTQEDCAAAEKPEYDEMVGWEESIADSYEEAAPAAMAILAGTDDERVRGGALHLVSQLASCRATLLPLLYGMFDDESGTGWKVDVIEALAHAGITLDREGTTTTSSLGWLHARRETAAPGIRLGAALSLLPRVESVLRGSLEESVARSTDAERDAVMEAMWLHGRTVEWATRRRVNPTRYVPSR